MATTLSSAYEPRLAGAASVWALGFGRTEITRRPIPRVGPRRRPMRHTDLARALRIGTRLLAGISPPAHVRLERALPAAATPEP